MSPKYSVGQKFVIKYGMKVENGTWQITRVRDEIKTAVYYVATKVLPNGKLSTATNATRSFSEKKLDTGAQMEGGAPPSWIAEYERYNADVLRRIAIRRCTE